LVTEVSKIDRLQQYQAIFLKHQIVTFYLSTESTTWNASFSNAPVLYSIEIFQATTKSFQKIFFCQQLSHHNLGALKLPQ